MKPPVFNLGDVCRFQNGFAFKSKFFTETGVPILRISNIQSGSIDLKRIAYTNPDLYEENLDKYLVGDGDLLIAMSGATTGKIGINKTGLDFLLNQRVGRFIPSNKLDQQYLYFYLSTKVEEHLEISAGAAQPNLSTEQIKGMKIPLPDIEEQKRIVAILDKAFAEIEQARANTEQNLKNARELFESYLQQVFSQRGEGWIDEPMDHLFKIKHGYAFKSRDFITEPDGELPIVLTPGNYTEYGDLYFTEKNTKRCISDYPSDFLFRNGDLTIVMTDLSPHMKILGKPAFIQSNNVLHNQRIGKFEFLTNKVEGEYLYYFLLSGLSLESIKSTATGATVRHTAPTRILQNNFPYPTDREKQFELVRALNTVNEKTKHLEVVYKEKLFQLDELKRSILQKAFTGELKATSKGVAA